MGADSRHMGRAARSHPPKQRKHVVSKARILAPTLLASVAAVAFSPTAHAAGYDCEASAFRASLLGAATVEPLVANRGTGTCATSTKTLASLATMPILGADLAVAATSLTGSKPSTQQAVAAGGIAGLRIGLSPELGLALPTAVIDDALGALKVTVNVPPLPVIDPNIIPTIDPNLPIPTIDPNIIPTIVPTVIPTIDPNLPIPTIDPNIIPTIVPTVIPTIDPNVLPVPREVTIDIRPAIEALLPATTLPTLELLSVEVANAYAIAGCSAGKAQLFGGSQVAGVKLLGQSIGLNGLLEQAIAIADSKSIDLSQLDLSKIILPAGLTLDAPVVGPLLTQAIEQLLATLPAIEIPATVAQVKLTPGQQTRSGGRLTQQALQAHVSLLGRTLVDATIGEASVAESAVTCTTPSAGSAAGESAVDADASELALECTKRRLVLTDVRIAGSRVRLKGVADKALVGKTVSIYFGASKRRVARAKVRKDGTFKTLARKPSKRLRRSNRARYQARIGRERSLDLKLTRRMSITSMKSSNGKVVIKGRLTRPFPKRSAPIVVKRRISCKKSEKVAVILPRKNGSFRVVVDAPEGRNAAVFRLSGRVQRTSRNSKTFPTYTLPHGVNLV